MGRWRNLGTAVVIGWAAALLGGLPSTRAAAATYYVSQSGDDAWDGLAGEREGAHGPWRSLEKASSVTCQPGDRLLLRCGDVWNETLTLRGNGTPDQPIVVASYGEGQRPFIRRTLGDGAACVVIDSCAGYHIRGLECGFAKNAIRILVDSRKTERLDGFLIEDCFFHNIENPTYPGDRRPTRSSHDDLRYMGWALFCDGFDSPQDVLLSRLTVRNCISFRAQAFFIQMGGVLLSNILFDGNTVCHSSYNSLYQAGAKDCDITNCVFVYSYPWAYHPNGATQILAWGVRGDATVRNEVIGNELGWAGEYPGCPDGCAYDFESHTSGVVFQSNLVHNTFGESVLFMSDCKHTDLLFDGNVFRNNVRFSPRWDVEVTVSESNTGNGMFSNNVFFSRPGIRAFSGKPECFTFSGNEEQATGSFAEMPLVSHIAFGEGERTYTLRTATPDASIRYTLDGSVPTADSALYEGAMTIRRSGSLNAKAFRDDLYPSYVNALVVDLRDAQGGPPIAEWQAGPDAQPSASARAKLARVADTFTIAFWATPEAERLSTTESESGLGVSKVAWWKMDEKDGTSVSDSVGGNSGGLKGCEWTQGKIGNGLYFNGTDDWVKLDTNGLGPVAGTFTIAFWAKPERTRSATPESSAGITGTSSDQPYAIFPLQYSATGEDVGVGVSVGTNGVSIFEHGSNHMPSPLVADCQLEGWNHIALVFRDNQATLFVNGEKIRTGSRSERTVHPHFDLGGMEYGRYRGTLDDIRVYPRPLDQTEIAQLLAGDPEGSVAWVVDDETKSEVSRFALEPVSRGGGSDARHAGVGVSVGTNGVSVFEASDDYFLSPLVDDIPLTGKSHITIVYRNQQPTLYLNGVYEKAGCKSTKTVHPVFRPGSSGPGRFVGELGAVRVYDRVLTDAEIQVLATGR